MLTLAEIKEKLAKAVDDARAIEAKAETEGRDLTDDESSQIQAHVADIKQLQADKKKAEERKQASDFLASVDREISAPKPPRSFDAETVGQPRIEVGEPEIAKHPTFGFKSHAHFFKEVMATDQQKAYSHEGLRFCATNSEGILLAAAGSDEHRNIYDPAGGFLVPSGFIPGHLSIGFEGDPTAGRATMVPMALPTVKINARVDKDHTSSVSGGFIVTRKSETAEGTPSTTKFEQITLAATTLFGVSFATEELLRDSPESFAAIIAAGFGEEFGAKMLDEKLHGSGNGEFKGVVEAPATIAINRTGGGLIDYLDILNMRSRCWRYGNAVWLANHDTMPQLGIMNRGVETAPLWQQTAQEDLPDILFGRPLIFTEFCKKLGDKGDIVLGNWSQYLRGDYAPMEQAESIHVRFLRYERTFRFTMRNDGRPWWNSSLKPKYSDDTLSPFVVLNP